MWIDYKVEKVTRQKSMQEFWSLSQVEVGSIIAENHALCEFIWFVKCIKR